MRKTDKKIDNHIRFELTQLCDKALKDIDGFNWLTHTVDFSHYPKSIKIIFVFNFNQEIKNYLQSANKNTLKLGVITVFNTLNINIKNIENHIFYDSEENCSNQHGGNWAIRLKSQ